MGISRENLRSLSIEELTALASSVYSEDSSSAEDGPPFPQDFAELSASDGDGKQRLSLAQERLWFMDRLSPQNPFYNIPFGLEIRGALNCDALQDAWLAIVARHECLTSVFPATASGIPVLGSLAPEQCALRTIDLRALDNASQKETLDDAKDKEAKTGFSLESGPLVRGTVYLLKDDESVLLYTFHHSVFDGWSLAVFLEELFDVYEGICAGTAPNLPEPASYVQFARWQREQMQGEWAKRERRWWKEHLRDVPSLDMRQGAARPSVQSFQGKTLSFFVPQSVSAPLDALAHQHGATPFMVWLAMYSLVLGRMSGQASFAVGSSVSGREHPQTERMVGFFLNNLVVKTNIDASGDFVSHLEDMRQGVLLALEHSSLPFQYIAEGLGQNLDISRNPVYQAALTYQNAPMPQRLPAGLALRSLFIPPTTTHLDMELLVEPEEGGHTLYLTYATDIFSHRTAEMVGQALTAIAGKLSTAPATPLRQLLGDPDVFSFATQGETSVLSGDGNVAPFRDAWSRLDELVHNRSEDTVVKWRPRELGDELAQDVTYSRLGGMANGAAWLLANQGAGPGSIVALMPDSPLELIIFMLAVWKTGAAWVPLDPEHPPLHNADVLKTSGASILVAPPMQAENLLRCGGDDAAVRLVPSSQDWTTIDCSALSLPAHAIAADDVACVLYTSGSTGTPKGIELTHGAMTHRWEWMWAYLPWEADSVAYMKTSPLFVDFLWEVFGAILGGAPLVVTGRSSARNVPAMMEEITRHAVTQMVLVPSLLAAMMRVAEASGGALPRLKTILSSGEPLSPELAVWAVRAMPGLRIVNLYGSTEVMDATYFCISPSNVDEVAHMEDVPLGVPIGGTTVALMDDFSLPVPAGNTGIIHIAGPSLARGYAGDNYNNAFLSFAHEDEYCHWFRIDDEGWIDEEGNLHYVGRRDRQIKIRGVRIEAGEVENVMQGFAGVQEAVVSVWRDGVGHKRLAGFIMVEECASSEGEFKGTGALRSFMMERLPAVMVPDVIDVVAQWPRTSSGKIDRQSLVRTLIERAPEGPTCTRQEHGSVERSLEQLWREAIGLQNICTERNFFEAGGNSLLLVQLHESIQREFETTFPLTVLFQHPTIESQAAFLRRQQGGVKTAALSAAGRPVAGLRARRMAARAGIARQESSS